MRRAQGKTEDAAPKDLLVGKHALLQCSIGPQGLMRIRPLLPVVVIIDQIGAGMDGNGTDDGDGKQKPVPGAGVGGQYTTQYNRRHACREAERADGHPPCTEEAAQARLVLGPAQTPLGLSTRARGSVGVPIQIGVC